MNLIDIDQLTPAERLDLIGLLWDSLDSGDVSVTPEQAAELDRRLTTLDEDIVKGRSADTVIAELEQRYR